VALSEREPLYYWRVRTKLPERYGQPCRVVVWGKLGSVLVEFGDGHRVVTSRHFIRKAADPR
jgi:hypothetical protein